MNGDFAREVPESVKAVRGLVSHAEGGEIHECAAKNIGFLQILGGLYLPSLGLGQAS